MFQESADTDLYVTNCCFVNNNATGTSARGGGFYSANSNPTIVNCEFVGNAAKYGGGLAGVNLESGAPNIVNCTFTANSVSGQGADGGAAHFHKAAAGTGPDLTLTNCILWGNSAGGAPNQIGLSGTGATVTVNYSDVEGGYVGTENIDADPLFENPSAGNYVPHLKIDFYDPIPTSPCVDAGDNAAVPADVLDLDGDGNTAEPLPIDLAGNPRFFDFATPAIVDMGAYEAGLGYIEPPPDP